MMIQHDNATPQNSLVTCQKRLQFRLGVLSESPHLPDLAYLDYNLFRIKRY